MLIGVGRAGALGPRLRLGVPLAGPGVDQTLRGRARQMLYSCASAARTPLIPAAERRKEHRWRWCCCWVLVRIGALGIGVARAYPPPVARLFAAGVLAHQ